MNKKEAEQHIQDRKEYEARELLDAERDNSEWNGETAEDKWRTDAQIDAQIKDKPIKEKVVNASGDQKKAVESNTEGRFCLCCGEKEVK